MLATILLMAPASCHRIVLVRRVLDSLPVAAATAAGPLVFCWGLWFGLKTWLRP
jgi:hypothetical protein